MQQISTLARTMFPVCTARIIEASQAPQKALLNRVVGFFNAVAIALDSAGDTGTEGPSFAATLRELLDLRVYYYYTTDLTPQLLDLIVTSERSMDAIDECPVSLNDPEVIVIGWLSDIQNLGRPITPRTLKFYDEENIVQKLRGIVHSAGTKGSVTPHARKIVALKLSCDILTPNAGAIFTPWWSIGDNWFAFEVWDLTGERSPAELVNEVIPLPTDRVTVAASMDLMVPDKYRFMNYDSRWWTIAFTAGEWDVVHPKSE